MLPINLVMADFDQQLEELVVIAQRYPSQAKERRVALGKLIRIIQQSGKLYCPRGQLSLEVYTYLYQEALQNLWIEVCRSVDSYDPTRSKVMTWVNALLKYRFIDARRKFYPHEGTRIHYTPDVHELDKLATSDKEEATASEQVKQWIEEDPDGLFRQKKLKSSPQVDFQLLALRRLAGDSWEVLSKEYEVKIPTLSNFYQRACKEFAPRLKEYLAS